MRGLLLGLIASALGACAPAAVDRPLDGLDLADGTTLAALQRELPLDDRGLLGTYALLHWPKSRFYCGKPVGGQPKEAATVGEAIAITRAYETALAAAQEANAAPAVANAGATDSLDEERVLIARMESIVLERDKLYAQYGSAGDTTAQGASIKRRLGVVRGEIEALRDARSL